MQLNPSTPKNPRLSSKRNIQSPTLQETDATEIFFKLKVPNVPKKKSPYVRFKAIMLQEAKKQNKSDIVSTIKAAAKTAWKHVEDYSVPNNANANALFSETTVDVAAAMVLAEEKSATTSNFEFNLDAFRSFKRRAIVQERNERQMYEEQLSTFQSKYLPAAISLLKWKTQHMNPSNYKSSYIQVWAGGLISTSPPSIKASSSELWIALNDIEGGKGTEVS